MLKIYSFLGLIFLILFQVIVLPLNLAFMAVFAFSLYVERFPVFIWLVAAAVLLALFANLNLGLILLSFMFGYLILNILSSVVPNNQLARVSLIIFSLLIIEVIVSFFERVIS